MKKGRDSRAAKGGKAKCAFCRGIGFGLSVFLSRGQIVPGELERFDIVLNSVAGYTLLRCPDCGTCFKRHTVIDNEIIYGYVSVEIEEIPAGKVRELQRLEKSWQRQFALRVDARLKQFRRTFTPREKEVVAAFITRQREALSIHELAQLLTGRERTGLQKTLDEMVEEGALKIIDLQGIRHYRIV